MKPELPSARDAGPLGQLSLWSIDQADQSWRVRVSERARRMTIRVFAGGRVEIVVPRWARAVAIQRFVHQHRGWVEGKIAELSSRLPAQAPARPEQIELAATGERWRLQYVVDQGPVRVRQIEDGMLCITGDSTRLRSLQRGLRDWLIAHARASLRPWLLRVSQQTGLSFTRLQIRRQRTRWGSCSVRGTVSLNCCLMFQSPAVVRYLLIHELCHTRHMNHSARFWQLVAQCEADFRALDRELMKGWQNVPPWVFGP